jgi:hypothetical protein
MLQKWQNLAARRAEAAHMAKQDKPGDHQTGELYLIAAYSA